MNAVPPAVQSQTRRDRLPSWSDPILFAASLGLLAAVIALFAFSVACIDGSGMTDGLVGGLLLLTLSPLCGVGCAVLSLVLCRRPSYRVLAIATLVIVVPFASPPINLLLARGLSIWNTTGWFPSEQTTGNATWQPASEMPKPPRNEAAALAAAEWDAAIARHYENLTVRFASGPQGIAEVYNGLIILDDGTVLSLYGLDRTVEVKFTLDVERIDLVNHGGVEVRLPEDASFRQAYAPIRPGHGVSGFDARALARSPVDERGWRYGAVPCLLYADGRLYNARLMKQGDADEFNRRYGSPHPR